MAVDMFMYIKDIEGEAQDTVHEKNIDVLAWNWGSVQSGTTHMGGGGSGGKVNVQDLTFTKYIDSATHLLFQRACDGEHIEEATLHVRKAGGKKPLEYLRIEMKNVIVSSLSTGANGSEDRLTEEVSLNFEEVKVVYIPQKPDGSGDAEKISGWNMAKNEVPA